MTAASPQAPLLDVVIPTATYGGRTDGLLSDLAHELGPFRALVGRIAVVDNTAVYDTAPRLLADGRDSRHPWPSDSNGPAVNRNRGAKDSDASWIVFLDDDVRLPAGWGQSLIAILKDDTAPDIIGGAIGSQRARNWFSQAAEDFVVRHRRYPEGWYLAAAHLIVRRSAFESLGGFDITYAYGAEDWDFSQRGHAQGLTIDVDPSVTVLHANPTTWSQLATKARQYGAANAHLDSSSAGGVESGPTPHSDATATSAPDSAAMPSPTRALAWLRDEYRLLRREGRSPIRAGRTMTLYMPWMAIYLRAQQRGS